jgi:hypothetical protein
LLTGTCRPGILSTDDHLTRNWYTTLDFDFPFEYANPIDHATSDFQPEVVGWFNILMKIMTVCQQQEWMVFLMAMLHIHRVFSSRESFLLVHRRWRARRGGAKLRRNMAPGMRCVKQVKCDESTSRDWRCIAAGERADAASSGFSQDAAEAFTSQNLEISATIARHLTSVVDDAVGDSGDFGSSAHGAGDGGNWWVNKARNSADLAADAEIVVDDRQSLLEVLGVSRGFKGESGVHCI